MLKYTDLTDPVKHLETESPKLKFDLPDPGEDKETGVDSAVLKSIDLIKTLADLETST